MKKFLLIALLMVSSLNVSARADEPLAMTEAQAREFCNKWLPNFVGGEPSLEKLMTF